MDESGRPTTLLEAVVEEQMLLWDDLATAMRQAYGGCWSVGCEGIAARIQSLAIVSAPTRWDMVPVEVLRSGVYERVLAEVGIVAPEPDWARVAECEWRIGGIPMGSATERGPGRVLPDRLVTW